MADQPSSSDRLPLVFICSAVVATLEFCSVLYQRVFVSFTLSTDCLIVDWTIRRTTVLLAFSPNYLLGGF